MPVTGGRPKSGFRIEIERPTAAAARGAIDAAPWTYAGVAHLPDRSHALRVVVGADGAVSVVLDDAAPPDLAEKVRLIVRSAWKQAHADGEPPAYRIVRWRGEK